MRDRIKQIMDEENLTPSLFADKLNIGRAVISHILNGRNNPSLDVVTRILDTIDYIDADWLLSGKGNMRRSDNIVNEFPTSKPTSHVVTGTLFDSFNDSSEMPHMSNLDTNRASSPSSFEGISESRPAIIPVASNKAISKVIIYYSDNTFQAFNPDNSPL